jgi:nitric oxide reductase activation protein
MRNYTVMNLFRDYNEINSNDKIFNYYAAGFNRDGMALRTAIHMMENSKYNYKLLIILSDGKPNDMLGVPLEGPIPFQREYSDETGVSDTAYEVRKGLKKGISIVCVFTGRDEDLPSVKRIYGQKFTRIEHLDKFAEAVGILIEKELINKQGL